MSGLLLILVLFLHFIGDFACQTRWMANNKSKNLTALFLHCVTYILVLSVGLGCVTKFPGLSMFLVVNFIGHLLTDSVTSRITSYCYHRQWIYSFFLTVGFDQFLHATCLILSAEYMLVIKK